MTSETLSRNTLSGDTAAPDRRGFLRRASAVGAVVVGGIAATWADAPAASASPFCCNLRYPNGPWCGGVKGTNSFTCAKGYTNTTGPVGICRVSSAATNATRALPALEGLTNARTTPSWCGAGAAADARLMTEDALFTCLAAVAGFAQLFSP